MTSIAAAQSSSASSSSSDAYSGLTTDEFIKIMLTELVNQDPMEPAKTADMVENLREVQSLLASQQEEQRADLSWAGELVGRTVTVSQSLVTNSEYNALLEDGLNPDVGAGSVTGNVTSFAVVDDQVWIEVDGHDYPIDNVTSLDTASSTASTLTELGASLSGRTVSYEDASGTVRSGTVTSVNLADDGSFTMTIDAVEVAFSSLRSVG